MSDADRTMAALARNLADTLARYAREPDDQREIARIHTEICAERRKELNALPPDKEPPA
jgi:hypothetical protein